MKNRITELRSIRPIPLLEAKQLLEANNGDIDACVDIYTTKAIKQICDATGCTLEDAEKSYTEEEFDINRAISVVKNKLYDMNYTPIAGVNKETLQLVRNWIYVVETENFGHSLSYKYLNDVVETLTLIPKLNELAVILGDAKRVYDQIFANYNDNQPLEEFVRLNRKLDDAPEFQLAEKQIPLQISYIGDEVKRHWRNVE